MIYSGNQILLFSLVLSITWSGIVHADKDLVAQESAIPEIQLTGNTTEQFPPSTLDNILGEQTFNGLEEQRHKPLTARELLDKDYDKLYLAQATEQATGGTEAEDKPRSAKCAAFAADIDADVGEIMRAGCQPTLAQMGNQVDLPLRLVTGAMPEYFCNASACG